MKSIGKRLVGNFMFIVIITVFILELFLIIMVKHNFYKNLQDNMLNQIKVSADLYNRYFSDTPLYENVLNNVDTFWKQSNAQVEIIDTSGKVLMDSIGVISGNYKNYDDVSAALLGKKGIWIGKVDYDNERVMAVSYPLKSGNNVVGVLRFVTSLREVNRDLKEIIYMFLAVGVIVIVISSIVSIILSKTIVDPIQEVTKTAEKMAKGDFKAQSCKKYDDEIGKLSDTLNYMAAEIVKKDQLKNEFISSVSHELRTPLTSIKGWAITLKDGGLEDLEMLQDGLDIIEKESDRLTGMVEELLDFSKFVSGKISLKRENVDVKELMEHIKKQLTPRASRDNLDFNVLYDENIPLIYSDANRLKQLFINLLDNAFIFTPKGGKVNFAAKKDVKNILFCVSDTGCGISKEELPKIKEKFYKGKSSKSKNGIGLSICDEIVRLMGGEFEVNSEIGRGTSANITLPIEECD